MCEFNYTCPAGVVDLCIKAVEESMHDLEKIEPEYVELYSIENHGGIRAIEALEQLKKDNSVIDE